MSFILRGPYPAKVTTTLMPSPAWGDSENIMPTIVRMRTVDGTLYTYVTSRTGRSKYHWEFELSRNKALELREFINSYFADLIEVQDHEGNTLVGYLQNNPFELSGVGRAKGWPGNSTMKIELDFEER